MKHLFLGLVLCGLAIPTFADDAAFGRRMASCSGVLEVWSTVLKEDRPTAEQTQLADDYRWKAIRMRKQAKALIGEATSTDVFKRTGGTVLVLLAQKENQQVRDAVDTCLWFYDKVMI